MECFADVWHERGWDQTGSNGANLNWPREFRLDTDRKSNDFWILGLVNAAPYIAAALMYVITGALSPTVR